MKETSNSYYLMNIFFLKMYSMLPSIFFKLHFLIVQNYRCFAVQFEFNLFQKQLY